MSRILTPRRDLILPSRFRQRQGGFLLNPFRFGGGAGGGSYLDALTVAPIHAWSVTKKMVSSATLAYRVRRTSDSAELDVGFVGDVPDHATAAAFCAGTNGEVAKIYDQHGGTIYLYPPYTNSAPRLFTSGTFLGHAKFDAVDDFLSTSAAVTLGTQYCGVYFRASVVNTTIPLIFEFYQEWNTHPESPILFYYLPYGGYAMGYYQTINASSGVMGWNGAHSTMANHAALFNKTLAHTGSVPGHFTYWQDGVNPTNALIFGGSSTNNFSANILSIGGRNGIGGFYADMELETFVVYNADSAGERTNIEALL